MVTGLVRRVYRENYVTTSLSYKRVLDGDLTNARYDMDYEGRHHSIAAQTHLKPSLPDPESADYFFVERYWGSPGGNGERVIVFDIEHVPWGIYDVDSYSVDADFGVLYGEEWGFLNGCTPEYVTWCDGSSVGISWPVRT